jgi:hypothetical protein
MAIFNNNNNDDALAVAGPIAAPPPVNQELLEKLTELADMLDDAFAMPNLNGVGDRAIIYFMSAITLSLNAITDAAEVETQLADVAEEIAAFGAAPPGGIDDNWWDTFHATLSATRNCLL